MALSAHRQSLTLMHWFSSLRSLPLLKVSGGGGIIRLIRSLIVQTSSKPTQSSVERAAILEINLLRWLDIIPAVFEDLIIGDSGDATTFTDTGGKEELYTHFPLVRDNILAGFMDVAKHGIFGAPLLRVGERLLTLDDEDQRESAGASSRRFVSYSFPKQGVLLDAERAESYLLDRRTRNKVPVDTARSAYRPPSVFEGWSLLEETPEKERKLREERFSHRVLIWDNVASRVNVDGIGRTVSKKSFEEHVAKHLGITQDSFVSLRRGVGFTGNPFVDTGIFIRPQEQDLWCAPASLQMILEHFRYRFEQLDLAKALRVDNGSTGFPLPASQSRITEVEAETRTEGALDVAWIPFPEWKDYANAICQFRPVLSFIWGHVRVAAGALFAKFKENQEGCYAGEKEQIVSLLQDLQLEGLMIADPWPVGEGTKVWWEDFGVLRHWLGISFGVAKELQLGPLPANSEMSNLVSRIGLIAQ